MYTFVVRLIFTDRVTASYPGHTHLLNAEEVVVSDSVTDDHAHFSLNTAADGDIP